MTTQNSKFVFDVIPAIGGIYGLRLIGTVSMPIDMCLQYHEGLKALKDKWNADAYIFNSPVDSANDTSEEETYTTKMSIEMHYGKQDATLALLKDVKQQFPFCDIVLQEIMAHNVPSLVVELLKDEHITTRTAQFVL